MDVCSTGTLPEIDHDSDNSVNPDQENGSLLVEEGDHLFATGLLSHPSMDIRASSTI